MEQFIQKLRQVLARSFPGSEVELEVAGPRRVGGLVTWSGFAGQEQIVRQRRLWQVLRAELSADEQLEISALLTLTPDEMAAARQD